MAEKEINEALFTLRREVEQLEDSHPELKDKLGRARIVHRIRSAEHGNFGDCESVGDGVVEMRIHTGPGFRVYFCRHGEVVYLLLCGGDKSSQRKDILAAKKIKKRLEEVS